MKKIWDFLKNHLQQDFHLTHYFSVVLLLAILLAINYTYDFEDEYLSYLTGFPKLLNYFVFYSVAYFSAVVLYAFFRKRIQIFSSPEFWIKSFFGLALLSLDSSVPFLQPLLRKTVPKEMLYWSFKVANNLVSFFTVFFPILIFYWVYEKKNKDLYGLRPRNFDVKPYFTMLLIMLPLMIAASGTDGFQRQYPMYKTSDAHEYLGVDEWVTVAIYEVAYGLDFITVEYLFRGFMVVAMMGVLGRASVLAMAVLYCTLHFGKPMGEAISSIFGGYILGVVAYETRSVWGGVIVHMGIAWMMEVIAFLSKAM
jgi:hypothetical protein